MPRRDSHEKWPRPSLSWSGGADPLVRSRPPGRLLAPVHKGRRGRRPRTRGSAPPDRGIPRFRDPLRAAAHLEVIPARVLSRRESRTAYFHFVARAGITRDLRRYSRRATIHSPVHRTRRQWRFPENHRPPVARSPRGRAEFYPFRLGLRAHTALLLEVGNILHRVAAGVDCHPPEPHD